MVNSSHLKYRADIDGLRAIAVVAVLLFHLFPSIFKGGFIGVDIFFVISGYLITSIIANNIKSNSFSLKDFYSRRIRRIFPALIIVMLSCGIAGWVLLTPSEYENLGTHIKAGATFISNFTLWNEVGYFDASSDTKPLLHLWSLAIEEQFYIFWPLMVVISYKVTRRFGIVVFGVLVASFASSIWLLQRDPTAAFYSPISRFWEILIGALLSSLAVSNNKFRNNLIATIGVGFLIVGMVFISNDRSFPGFWALLPTIGAAALIYGGQATWAGRVLATRPFVAIGLISYPLYLWHWPLISFHHIIYGELSIASAAVLAVIALAVAIITYRFIEKPLTKIFSNKNKVVIYSVGMAVVLVCGIVIYDHDGLPVRYPVEVQRLIKPISIEQWLAEVRSGKCHIQDPAKDRISEECFKVGSPSILLWGDSHAAALYPGFKELETQKDFYLSQVTHVGNPPFVEKSSWPGHYTAHNSLTESKIKNFKPDYIVLHGAWVQYGKPQEEVEDALSKTISAIQKDSPQTKIILVGPVPAWDQGIQKSILQYYRDHQGELLPEYTFYSLNRKSWAMDSSLADFSKKRNLLYISLLNYLCNESGCLTRLGRESDDLVNFDEAHLSPKGSKFVVSKLFADLKIDQNKTKKTIAPQ